MSIEFHLFVFVFAVIYPLVGYVSYKKLQRRIAAGESVHRKKLYRGTIVNQLLLFVAGSLLWTINGQPWSLVGVALPDSQAVVLSMVAILAVYVVLLRQVQKLRAEPDAAVSRYAGQMESLEIVVPRTSGELRDFRWLSLTAGVVEEFLWRGLLIWYFEQYIGLIPAAVVSTVAFGFAHAYQGLEKVLQIILVGAGFTVLYLLTESLLPVVILHVMIDLMQGRLAYDIAARLQGLILFGHIARRSH